MLEPGANGITAERAKRERENGLESSARDHRPGSRRSGDQAPRLAGLTPSGRAIVPASWALYDFANTIFSFAVVSGAIGLYLVRPSSASGTGTSLLSIAVVVSVGINALVSPILGAFSDRGTGRMPFLLFFTALCIGATFFIADVPVAARASLLFIVANFAYQAALIYYDATLKVVSYPATRGKLSGIGTGIGYCGTVFVGLLIFLARRPGRRPVPADGHPVPALRDPDLRLRARAADRRRRRP